VGHCSHDIVVFGAMLWPWWRMISHLRAPVINTITDCRF